MVKYGRKVPASTSDVPVTERAGWLRAARHHVHRLPAGRTVWRVGVTLVGSVIILVGAVLLPLPGPGWLIIFAGLGVLATEFAWAHRLLRRARALVAGWTRWVLRQNWWVRGAISVLGLVLVAAFILGAWELSGLA